MKVLLIHNFYQSSSPSGEDSVLRSEGELLRKNSVDVVMYQKHNDEIRAYRSWEKFLLSFRTIWSLRTYKEIRELIKKEKPDIAHFHNISYLISPSAYDACKEGGIPVVQTLHNFRFFCVNGLLMRNGKICEECIGKSPWKGVRYGCYRDSQLYSFPIALSDAIHKLVKTWERKVDAFIALTEFGRKKFIACGLPEKMIFVKPNFLHIPPAPNYTHNGYVVFLGRISAEKGLDVLINAFSMVKLNSSRTISMKIVGDGPLRERLQETVKTRRIEDIEFTGRKSFDESMKLLQQCQFAILPAIWYETFGLSGIEAFACGKPVIASRLGAMAELVEHGRTGLLFEPGNPADLAEKIEWMIDNEDACVEMGKNARAEFEEKYTAGKNFEILMKIYEKVLSDGNEY